MELTSYGVGKMLHFLTSQHNHSEQPFYSFPLLWSNAASTHNMVEANVEEGEVISCLTNHLQIKCFGRALATGFQYYLR